MANFNKQYTYRIDTLIASKLESVCKDLGLDRSVYVRNLIERALNNHESISEQNRLIGSILENCKDLKKDQALVKETLSEMSALSGSVLAAVLFQKQGGVEMLKKERRAEVGIELDAVATVGRGFSDAVISLTKKLGAH